MYKNSESFVLFVFRLTYPKALKIYTIGGVYQWRDNRKRQFIYILYTRYHAFMKQNLKSFYIKVINPYLQT